MREEFLIYFRETESQVRDFPRLPFIYPFPFPFQDRDIEWLVQLLDEEAAEILKPNGVVLRSDAFLFLIVNLRIMIIDPWQYTREQPLPESELVELLRNDIRMIYREVVQRSVDEKHEEVSANSIFQAVASLSDNLKSRAEELWGP